MPARPKPENKNTTLYVAKITKLKLRRFAQESKKRKGYETDDEVLYRVLEKFGTQNPIGDYPHPTY